jgi:protein-S-isoprenylcysteine O-methyltransferase Ste14
MVITGAIVNILSISQLKGNWSDNIKIYEGHIFVKHGVYGIVRHPLYASIIMMLFGGSFVCENWLAFVLASFIFVPLIYYRARQEEILLREEFVEYGEYAQNTGMFLPKIRKQGASS